jgi:Immunity protein 53
MRLSALENWYASQCDGKWEHGPGVRIETLDNPGWRAHIPLRETKKQDTTLAIVKLTRSQDDWISYWVEKQEFQFACGPKNLSEAIDIFVRWFESE